MSIVIKKELDPIYEILNLLYLSHHEDWKDETIKELHKYGIEGNAFFEKHFKIIEKYLKVFQKYKVTTLQESYFFDECNDDYLLLLLALAIENRQYMESDRTPGLMELRSFLACCMMDTDDGSMPDVSDIPQLPDEKSIIEFLDSTDIKNCNKWYMLEFLRTPDQWLIKLFDTIRANMPAYEKAITAIKKPLTQLFERNTKHQDAEFFKIAEAYRDDIVIYASLATPLVQAILYSNGYQGLLICYLDTISRNTDTTRETLIRQMKSLSDKSKLDILCELKKSSKYNLELSEALGLSPSTMSHHMSALLSCGFVTVEKKNGKVYYCIQENVVRKFLAGLEQLIL